MSTQVRSLDPYLLDWINDCLTNGADYQDGPLHSESVSFGNGYEMDVEVITCPNNELPYIQAVLFKDGHEVNCTSGESDQFEGPYELSHGDKNFRFVIDRA